AELEALGVEETHVGSALLGGTVRRALTAVEYAYNLVGTMEADNEEAYLEANETVAHKMALAANVSAKPRLMFLSFIEASPASDNFFLRYKGRGEQGIVMNLRNHMILRSSWILYPGCPLLRLCDALLASPDVPIAGTGNNLIQPIALDDAVEFLIEATDCREKGMDILEIGGADRISFKDFLRKVAQLKGITRIPEFKPKPTGLAGLAAKLRGAIGTSRADVHPTVLDLASRNATADLVGTARWLEHKPQGLDAALKDAMGV
ncbi:MAG: hypothetical protein KC466_12020, partial [Myxococcales bacterium]|nr:hypothetical protein [Myxococcales bacterium]